MVSTEQMPFCAVGLLAVPLVRRKRQYTQPHEAQLAAHRFLSVFIESAGIVFHERCPRLHSVKEKVP